MTDKSNVFPTLEAFEVSPDRIIPWRDLELFRVFEIKEIDQIKTKGGREAVVLTLVGKDNTVVKVWATSLIVRHIEEKKHTWAEKKQFIISKGKKTSESSGKEYFNFKILNN